MGKKHASYIVLGLVIGAVGFMNLIALSQMWGTGENILSPL